MKPITLPMAELKPALTGLGKLIQKSHGLPVLKTIKVARNPNYWKPGKPYLDEIYWQIIPDAAARSVAFETGKVDVLLRVWRTDDETFVLDTDAGFGDTMVARLNRFKIRVKVEITDVSEQVATAVLRGPGTASVLRTVSITWSDDPGPSRRTLGRLAAGRLVLDRKSVV